jgi:polyisoprenoid-binding protein YceI
MIKINKFFALALFVMLGSFTAFYIADWQIAEGYNIKFDGKYAHGTFSDLSGLISFDPEKPEAAKFDVAIKTASIDTGIELKNKHAKSDKWFDAEQFPLIRFTSSKVARTDSGYVITGTLDMHGFRKPISIPFSFKDAANGSRFYGKFKINRGDFGIGKTNGKESDSTLVEVSVPVISK